MTRACGPRPPFDPAPRSAAPARLAVVALSFLMAACGGERGEAPGPSGSGRAALPRGPMAPPLDLPDLQGTRVNLASFRGHPVIVNFWATWCAPCRREMPSLVALKERLGKGDPEVLAVSIDDDHAAVREFLARSPLPFRILLDPGRATADRFAVTTVPSTFILDGEGRVVERLDGEVDWSDPEIGATVERLVAEAGASGQGA